MRLKKMLENLAGNVAQLNERLVRVESATASPSLGNNALEKFAVAAVEHQAQQLGAVGDLISTIANVAASKAASTLGKRRAASARRDPRSGRLLKNAKPDCRLCDNPSIIDPTSEEIREHAKHERGSSTPEPAPAPAITYRETPNAVHATVPEALIQTGPDGTEQVECPECGSATYKRPLAN